MLSNIFECIGPVVAVEDSVLGLGNPQMPSCRDIVCQTQHNPPALLGKHQLSARPNIINRVDATPDRAGHPGSITGLSLRPLWHSFWTALLPWPMLGRTSAILPSPPVRPPKDPRLLWLQWFLLPPWRIAILCVISDTIWEREKVNLTTFLDPFIS